MSADNTLFLCSSVFLMRHFRPCFSCC